MDAQVPRNNAVPRVHSRRPYRPRQPGQLIQNDMFKTISRQLYAGMRQQQAERRLILEVVHGGAAEPTKTKRTRQNFRAAVARTVILNGELKTLRVRDVVQVIPPDSSAVVACNPVKEICQFRAKKVEKDKIETVAKPRHRTPGHTLILTYVFDQPEDLERLLDQAQQ